jgi:hypothetical protein
MDKRYCCGKPDKDATDEDRKRHAERAEDFKKTMKMLNADPWRDTSNPTKADQERIRKIHKDQEEELARRRAETSKPVPGGVFGRGTSSKK